MALICITLTIFVVALLYRNKRDKEIIAETLEYYSGLANQLSAELKSHRDLTTFLAHDLKSPLAGIISSAQALELAGQSLPSTYLECLRLMQVSGRSNLRLLSNFIELLGSSSEPAKTAVHTFPDNRLDLLRSLVEPGLIQDGRLSWEASPWDLRTHIALKHFSTAFAEIVSVICSQKDSKGAPKNIKITESFDSETNQLRISFEGISPLADNPKNSSSYPYTLALQVVEKLGVTILFIENSDQASLIEFQLPICECVAKENHSIEMKEGQARAELLLELSLKQVKSATLSVGSLSDLPRMNIHEIEEEAESDAEEMTPSVEAR